MGDDPAAAAAKKEVNPFKFIEQRVATTFPAIVGPKFTAKYATEQNEYVTAHNRTVHSSRTTTDT